MTIDISMGLNLITIVIMVFGRMFKIVNVSFYCISNTGNLLRSKSFGYVISGLLQKKLIEFLKGCVSTTSKDWLNQNSSLFS